MKIDTFAYVDRVVNVLENDRAAFSQAAAELIAFLEQSLGGNDEIVGITDRIKTSASLREKIVRNGLYKQYPAEELLYHMSDIIGVRIECRFLADEQNVFAFLRALFCNRIGDGPFYAPEGNAAFKLNLDAPQPEQQKNGLNIYRIDGYVERDGVQYNFEIQIKSLVNSFWSEIEHKLIYKNKRFMMIDRFVNDMMLSIHESLINIDAQLNMIYSRCLNNNVDQQMQQIENVLTALINEVYTNLIEEKVGLGVNIKDYSESLVKYILYYSSFIRRKAGPDEMYGNTVMNVMNWMRKVDFDAIRIGEKIYIEGEIAYENDLQRTIGAYILEYVNSDFYLNTFFHIFFSIEVGDDAQDFLSYVKYYEKRISAGADSARRVLLKDRVRHLDPCKMVLEKTFAELRE